MHMRHSYDSIIDNLRITGDPSESTYSYRERLRGEPVIEKARKGEGRIEKNGDFFELESREQLGGSWR